MSLISTSENYFKDLSVSCHIIPLKKEKTKKPTTLLQQMASFRNKFKHRNSSL